MVKHEIVTIGGTKCRMPTNEWAEELRRLFGEHVKPVDPADGWKGPCFAVVPEALAADVREAMNFMGALVDSEAPVGDEVHVELRSDGYWAHGF